MRMGECFTELYEKCTARENPSGVIALREWRLINQRVEDKNVLLTQVVAYDLLNEWVFRYRSRTSYTPQSEMTMKE